MELVWVFSSSSSIVLTDPRIQKCNHFAWLDEEMSPGAEELMSALLKNLNEEKEMVNTYKAKEEELKAKVKILKKQLKINWILLFVMLFAFVGTTLMK